MGVSRWRHVQVGKKRGRESGEGSWSEERK